MYGFDQTDRGNSLQNTFFALTWNTLFARENADDPCAKIRREIEDGLPLLETEEKSGQS